MQIILEPPKTEWPELLQRPVIQLRELEARVAPILEQVQENGDAALQELTAKFDKVDTANIQVSQEEIDRAVKGMDESLKEAIHIAALNIEGFHFSQKEQLRKVETMPGVLCWRKSVAIEKVGLYIPGGTAPLFSSIMMLAIPAKIAGCSEIILCTPPGKDGDIHPAILYTAHHVGVNKIYKVGGAQAVAAMAYGTETVPSVDKIFGPGNQYVTLAKQLVAKEGVAIDLPAGPSEVAVVADHTANPSFVAADLLSQAEHGIDSQVLLVTTDQKIVERVNEELEKQLAVLPRAELAQAALGHSKSIVHPKMEDIIEIINAYAPEHLILSIENDEEVAEKIINAGSVFLGHFTPESIGDYASGTNHTLPTNGYARAYSGVSLDSFVKKITFQKLSKNGLQRLGPVVEKLASAEELEAHKMAVSVRLAELNKE